jgi:twitching motility protein PilJ
MLTEKTEITTEKESNLISNQKEKTIDNNNNFGGKNEQQIDSFPVKNKIRTQILITVLPLVLIPIGATSLANYWLINERLEPEIGPKVENPIVVEQPGKQEIIKKLVGVFVGSSLIFASISVVISASLARQLAEPLINLAKIAEEVTEGNLEVFATEEGSLETATLAVNFNNLISRVKSLLEEQQQSLQELEIAKLEAENLAQEQTKQRETIQQELFSLLSDVEGVSSGDLTVRAQISAGEIGIVADFFNSIVENLRDIVTQVKETTSKVNESLLNDEEEMGKLAKEALKQSKKIQRMLEFVEEMTESIERVAQNTQTAAQTAQQASKTAENGEITIDKTVNSIVQLRETVGETAKKVKRLGESSQQISKVISLINQIALQTNLLAINASIEAARAGEEGRGFAVVAEEVGQLAAQSAQATKEIEQIVETIQKETADVVEAMENGTTQVVIGSNLVTEAKKNFGQIVKVSQEIEQLLQSISTATISQTKTSEMVGNLMKEIAKVSIISSNSSRQVAESLEKTVNNARELQTSVETFKVSS